MNIVQFLGAALAGDQIMLVTEYMPRGDLWRALSQDSANHFSWRSTCAPHPRLLPNLSLPAICVSMHFNPCCNFCHCASLGHSRSAPQPPAGLCWGFVHV